MKKSIFIRVFKATLFSCMFILFCCESDSEDNGGGGSLNGVWVRSNGPSGDETDIAIGGIAGEPDNRVYMCEWEGVVGLYKGYIEGNTITWDVEYGLPNSYVRIVGGQLEFSYPSEPLDVPAYYDLGTWSNNCGPLENSITKVVVGDKLSEHPGEAVVGIWIDNIVTPFTALNSTVTEPDCLLQSNVVTLGFSSNFTHQVKIIIQINPLDPGAPTHYTYNSTIPSSYFVPGESQCNRLKVVKAAGIFTLIPMP